MTIPDSLTIYQSMGVSKEVYTLGSETEEKLRPRFEKIDRVAEINQLKVLSAMRMHQISEACLFGSTGYGYNDLGREKLEKVYASIFNSEDALVRPQIACGTHALATAMFGILRPEDELLSPVGKPYDTLQNIIGKEYFGGAANRQGSLSEYGITYKQVDLCSDGSFDYDNIKSAISDKTRLVTIQRSRGYQNRPSLSVTDINKLIEFIKNIKSDIICMVDNCYGEFTEEAEVCADMIVGSLIKNIGGGLAPTGGYIAGKKELVEAAAYRLTSPGLGKEVGASLNVLPSFYQGLFLSPTVTAAALKTAIFAAAVYERLGYEVSPKSHETRHDIVQSVTMGDKDTLIKFCEGIQSAAPVDSHVSPRPEPMPGYDNDIIMAAGAFIQGSSIELSADGPIKPPYTVYFQGGLTWQHGKFGILNTVETLKQAEIVKL